ncbi:MAG TPA: glycerol kinase, partial [Acholeplasma sp.]|nr:glycerol kinase [Acholeplasma sp.]
FQADLINAEIVQNYESEVTGLGAAFMAGLSVGFWDSVEDIKKLTKIKKVFVPKANINEINDLYKGWLKAVEVIRDFKK